MVVVVYFVDSVMAYFGSMCLFSMVAALSYEISTIIQYSVVSTLSQIELLYTTICTHVKHTPSGQHLLITFKSHSKWSGRCTHIQWLCENDSFYDVCERP